MTKIMKAPEKKTRFDPLSEGYIIEEFNKKVTSQNYNYHWGFTIDFTENEKLVIDKEGHKRSQIGKYIREHSEEFEKQGYQVESYRGVLTSSVKVSW